MYEQHGLYTCRSRIQQSIRIKKRKALLVLTATLPHRGGAPGSIYQKQHISGQHGKLLFQSGVCHEFI